MGWASGCSTNALSSRLPAHALSSRLPTNVSLIMDQRALQCIVCCRVRETLKWEARCGGCWKARTARERRHQRSNGSFPAMTTACLLTTDVGHACQTLHKLFDVVHWSRRRSPLSSDWKIVDNCVLVLSLPLEDIHGLTTLETRAEYLGISRPLAHGRTDLDDRLSISFVCMFLCCVTWRIRSFLRVSMSVRSISRLTRRSRKPRPSNPWPFSPV